MASNRQTRGKPPAKPRMKREAKRPRRPEKRGGELTAERGQTYFKAAPVAVSPTVHQCIFQHENTDETGKDLNSLPMISGNSPSYQGFRDCARPPFARSGARFVEFADIGTRQKQMTRRRDVLVLIDRRRAGNRGRNAGPRDQPCQRDGGRRAAMRVG